MDNFKRSLKRLLTRLAILALVVACGAFAIAQAQKEQATKPATEGEHEAIESQESSGIADTLAPHHQEPSGLASFPELPASSRAVVTDHLVTPAQAVETEPFLPPPTSAAPIAHGGDATSRFGSAPGPVPYSDPTASRYGDAEPVPVHSGDPNDVAPDRFGQPPPDQFHVASEEASANDRFSSDTSTVPGLIDESDIPPLDETMVTGAGLPALDETLQENLPPADEQPLPDVDGVHHSTAAAATAGLAGAPPARVNPVRSNAPTIPYEQPVDDETFGQTPPDVFGSSAAPVTTPSYDAAPQAIGDEGPPISGGGKPGPLELEGPQMPSLTILKMAPPNVRVGAPAEFQINVRNNGQVAAERVLIRDEVPQGTELLETTPQAQPSSDGALLWSIGTLRPGEDVTVSMKVKPLEEGLIGSVASVTMQASASARVDAKKPMLKIQHSAPQQTLVGETVTFTIVLENPGSGTVERVVIEEDVPAGLAHARGPKLEYEVGSIPPGGSRRLELSLQAAEAGVIENVIRARGLGDLTAEHRISLEVTAPQLNVKVKGPTSRYLDRAATFTVALENPGTAPARHVELVTTIPQGLQFVSTNNSGRFDPLTNTIHWSLDSLPARQYGEVKFTALPKATGSLTINARATAERGLKDSVDHALSVDGIAALLFEVADELDPIGVGDTTTYSIRVMNQGTKEATNVQFVAIVPDGMQPVSATGPSDYRVEGNRIVFAAIPRVPPKAESAYNVRVKGIAQGDQRFRVQMTSDDTTTPVVEEESTKVYAD